MALVPTIIRAYSITSNICAMPSCTSPSRWPTAGTPCCPNVSSQVADALSPILCSTFVANTPLRSPSAPGRGVEVELRHEEQRQALRAGLRRDARALRAGQHEMHDVLGEVVLGRGDEPLHPVEVPGAVGLRDGPGAARADVRPGVRLGEHHRRAPPALDHQLGPAALLRRGEAVHDRGEPRAGEVEEHRGIGGRGSARPRPTAPSTGRRARPAPAAGPAATTRRPTAGGRPASPGRERSRCASRGRTPAGAGRPRRSPRRAGRWPGGPARGAGRAGCRGRCRRPGRPDPPARGRPRRGRTRRRADRCGSAPSPPPPLATHR